ncbi:hypothetical protein AN958_08577 [Leucoagaricus sp. SymC.cos]|nr:hypothetical protein AN958_08577 [Leucoagaricus sp. SymC.cos]
MVPLVPALVLAFVSFLASAFVILRIIIPILPPHPLSKRVSPAEFGLPTFRTLSPADKAHVWLASLDLVALAVLIWQTASEATGGASGLASAADPVSSVRLWVVMTIRQTILLAVVGLTLLHVRLGRPVSFGQKHWVLWAPSLVIILTSTTMSGVMSGAGVDSLFYGLLAYTLTVAVMTFIAFSCLIATLFVIKRNLNVIDEMNPWPPVREVAEKPRPSFATEDIDALREGGSWISSNSSTSSHRNSITAWSFSTYHTAPAPHSSSRPQTGGHPSVPVKSSSRFGAASRDDIPPVPPLPSPYSQASPTLPDADPFHRDTSRPHLGPQTSWLTSTDGSHSTMSAWPFPTTHHEPSVCCHTPSNLVPSRSNTPTLGDAKVLSGYGFNLNEVEKGATATSCPSGVTPDIFLVRNLGWFSFIFVPYAFSLPYLIFISQNLDPPVVVGISFVLSVTLSSPILALNVFFISSFPIPTGPFDASTNLLVDLRGPKESLIIPAGRQSHEYKRSVAPSVIVVEDRRSGDIWIAKGDAVDGKGKLDRVIEVLNPCPKLSVIPPQEFEDVPLTPPLPIQDEFSLQTSAHNTPDLAQIDCERTESKASLHLSGVESLAVASKVMIAQRHYSALAQTVTVHGHLRSRSVTTPSTLTPAGSFKVAPTPPPPFPLPPTPLNVRVARVALSHKKSFSSGFNFGQIDDMAEIDALSAGILPFFVPSLSIGDDAKVKDDSGFSTPVSYNERKGMKMLKNMNEFGLDFSSTQASSTPVRRPRNRKQSGHNKNRYSLPSLCLGKDSIYSLAVWSTEVRRAIDRKATQCKYFTTPSIVEVRWRNTVFGDDAVSNSIPHLQVHEPADDYYATGRGGAISPCPSACTLCVDIPGTDPARLSLLGMSAPLSTTSTVTLFDDIEADFADGPLAESTPHNTVNQNKTRKQPPLPSLLIKDTPQRHSDIVYIKSEESAHDIANATPPNAGSTTVSAMVSVAQWSDRVKPLITKTSKLQRKISNTSSIIKRNKSSSVKAGLRPLTLLQDRNINNDTAVGPIVLSETRPLSPGKKQKSRRAAQEENAAPESVRPRGSSNKLKPLKLARSETSKMQGILRQTEVLPQVVVRPPESCVCVQFKLPQ